MALKLGQHLDFSFEMSQVVGCWCRQKAVEHIKAVQDMTDSRKSDDALESEAEVLSNEVGERHVIEGCGAFTAFTDGRVRARFVDRTVVTVDRWHRNASVLSSTGSRTIVSVRTHH